LTAEVWDFPILGFPEAKISGKIVSNITKIYPDRYLYDGKDQSIDLMVAYRTQLGNAMMSRGRVIISDRLHASIMATLIDRPVVYIDNSYRKSSRVRSTLAGHIPECTDTVLNAHYASDIEAAVEIASKMLKRHL
jgi:exopolysaccharide biosynthesis predicted pyruvyltransferase EpsI